MDGWGKIENKDHLSPVEAGRWAELDKTDIEICLVKNTWEEIRSETEREKANSNKEKDLDDIEQTERKEGELDLRFLKATDMKANKRIKIPIIDDVAKEVHRTNMKNVLVKVAEDFIKEKCDKNGNLKETNIDRKHLNAIKQL